MSHNVQDPNVPYGLNLGRPLNTIESHGSAGTYPTGTQQISSGQQSSVGQQASAGQYASSGAQYASSNQYATSGQTHSSQQAGDLSYEGEGVTREGFVASQRNPEYASTATLANQSQTGSAIGGHHSQHQSSGQYASSGQNYSSSNNNNTSNVNQSSTDNEYGREHHHRGNHQPGNPDPDSINATEKIREGGVTGRDVTLAGFNPKDTHNIESNPKQGKEVERMSTPGPHGLVWLADQHKYVHRRELDGDTSAAADALYRKKREAEQGEGSSSGAGSSSRSNQQYGSNDRSNPNYNASAVNPTHGSAHGQPMNDLSRQSGEHHHHQSGQHSSSGQNYSTSGQNYASSGQQGYQPGHAAQQSAHAVGVSPAGTESHNSTTSQFDGRPASDTRAHAHEALNRADPRVHADGQGNYPVAANSGAAGQGRY